MGNIMKTTLLLILSLLVWISPAKAADKTSGCYSKYIQLANDYSDNKKYTEAVAFYEMANKCASKRKESIISSAGLIASTLKNGNKEYSKELLEKFIARYPKSKWGTKFRDANFSKANLSSKKKIYTPPCEEAKQGTPHCSIGNLVISQEWQVNTDSQDGYTSTDKIHVVKVSSKDSGEIVSMSCEDIVKEGMWCQIASGIGDPHWEGEGSLFPIKKYSYTTISKDFIGITVRSSANGGYHASQFLFDISSGNSVKIPGIYGRFSDGSIVEEAGHLYVDSNVDNSFRMATCCSTIEMTMKKRLYKINPYTLAISKIKLAPNLPPKSSLTETLLLSSKKPSATNVKKAFTDIWRYHTLSDDKGWLIGVMEAFKSDVLPLSEQAFEHYSNDEIIDRMIRWAK